MINKLAALSSRQQYGLSLLMGILAASGHPPLHVLFAPFIAFPVWLGLTEVNQQFSWKKQFLLGWLFGLGYFSVGLYWITLSLGVDLEVFWWLVPFALLGIPTALGAYVGVMTIFLWLTRSSGFSRCFWFAALWTTAEIAWGTGPLALPWNPLGDIWTSFDPVMQSLSLIGIYGLTLMTALFVSFPILLRRNHLTSARISYVAGLFILFGIATAWGIVRPGQTPVEKQHDHFIVRIVQPCVPLEMSWNRDKAKLQVDDLLKLSSSPSEKSPNVVVWPESALPLLLDEDASARQYIMQGLPANAYLISGALRRIRNPGEKVIIHNGLMVVSPSAEVIAKYDKHHLVPFGEYLPLRQYIPDGIKKVTSGEIDYTPGSGPETISVDAVPAFSPLICFEGIFSAHVIAPDAPRPKWLLNITNDAWFGRSSGPYQHLQLARMRSIEEGVPLVRAANTGISAVFDAFGREVARKPLNEKGILDAELPPALQEPTIFAKYGQLIFMILMLTFVVLGLVTRRD